MPEGKVTKVHNNPSNRASTKPVKDAKLERKVVYKSVLDNPFRVRWPDVPLNVQNSITAVLVSLLEGVAEYQIDNRKRKHHQQEQARMAKRRKSNNAKLQETGQEAPALRSSQDPPSTAESTAEGAVVVDEQSPSISMDEPDVLKHLEIGINQVTKRLELEIEKQRSPVVLSNKPEAAADTSSPTPLPIAVVLVCKGDVDPPILINHIPHLVAAHNALAPSQIIKLVPLPKGAEFTLAEALGLRRVSAMTLDMSTPGLDALNALLPSVPTVAAAWLAPPSTRVTHKHTFVPAHIKQLKTTAPKDMRAAKEQRVQKRAALKKRKAVRAEQDRLWRAGPSM
ncbi:hypothetical protein FISHEDRAFT_43792 [Fistulina hepatica ATCC 64428]|uniref:Ribosomal protein L7Ae/L30e/S12e/Gadd45 domain-containing protein n=1 Tax=Fistulina hepatica ATCC 64428 TaxID=1128425 RepID=A0A0D7ABY1_9AGAR|nr:hypothetical protein FISHEDRAFT_43792 [Fistulina hepatica ATCC 64428]